MIRIAVVIGLLLIAGEAWAVQYCVDSSARQEAALTWMVSERNIQIGKENAARAGQFPPTPNAPPETNQSYMTEQVKDVLKGYVKKHQADAVDTPLKTDVEAASDATKTKIRNVLTCNQVTCP